jgi:hypothetical protein
MHAVKKENPQNRHVLRDFCRRRFERYGLVCEDLESRGCTYSKELVKGATSRNSSDDKYRTYEPKHGIESTRKYS